MNVTIAPARLRGAVTPPPSKSQAHRVLIAAALSGGISRISNVAFSKDIQATLSCLKAMGTRVETVEEGVLEIHGLGHSVPQNCEDTGLLHFHCGESGSTLRFMIPAALTVVGGGRFTGEGRLMERPQKPYFDLFVEKGIACELKDGVLTVSGQLRGGEYRLPGNVSSQFVTGLLYALPLLQGDSKIVLTTALESKDYVDMTLNALKLFGVECRWEDERTLLIPGGQRYCAANVAVEADWSQAGFFYAALGLGNELDIQGMNATSTQGDMRIVPYYLKLSQPGDVELDVSQCPDLVPPLAAHAAVRRGSTRIINAGRLRIKESDRLASVTQALAAMGARIEEHPDSLTICGVEALQGGVTVDCCNDHRIAMMAAVAATRCREQVTLLGAECVAKSYPNFWEEYERLGGKIQ